MGYVRFRGDQANPSFISCVLQPETLILGCSTYSAANPGNVNTNALKCAECEIGKEEIMLAISNTQTISQRCVTSSFPSKDANCISFTDAPLEAAIFCKTCTSSYVVLKFRDTK
jgi:hypothetical protein